MKLAIGMNVRCKVVRWLGSNEPTSWQVVMFDAATVVLINETIHERGRGLRMELPRDVFEKTAEPYEGRW